MTLDGREEPALGRRAADAVELVRRHFGDLRRDRREAVLRALQSRRRARPGGLAPAGPAIGAALAVCVAVVAAIWVRHPTRSAPASLSFRIEGGELRAGGYVEAGPSSRPVVRFSDGSEVALSEGTKMHVRAVDEHGARVSLEQGRAHAYVVHTSATRWSFDAGPYVVAVTGTAFGISWAASEQRLEVRLENGTVQVAGPVFDTPVALRAGQALTVRGHEVVIRDLSTAERDTDSPREETSLPPAPPDATPASAAPRESPSAPAARAHRPARPSPATPATAAGHGWAGQVADGQSDAVVDEALRLGLDAVLESSGSDDLAALADAARYTRRYDVARAAFVAVRRRFGASERARLAAFSLGRLAESQRDTRVALSWFETYLMESPDGLYASEALGRKMLLVERLDGREAARPLAEAYERRFSTGTYAQAAHAITSGP